VNDLFVRNSSIITYGVLYHTADLNTGWHVTRIMSTQCSFRKRKLLAPFLTSIIAFLKSKSVIVIFSSDISVIPKYNRELAIV
jgi:hypothetical protein